MRRYLFIYVGITLFITLFTWFLLERKFSKKPHHQISASSDDKQLIIPKLTDYELCIDLQKNQELNYNFTTEVPVTFNLHYHEGQQAFYPVRRQETAEWEGIFEAAQNKHYCLMWENKEKKGVQLEYQFNITEK